MTATPSVPQDRIAAFVRELRGAGWVVGLSQAQDCLRFAVLPGLASLPELKQGLRSILCSNRVEWGRFDQVFDDFWGEPIDPKALSDRPARFRPSQNRGVVGLATATRIDPQEQEESLCGAGQMNAFGKTDFRFFTDHSAHNQAARLAERLARTIKRRKSRRWRPAKSGQVLDARATLRRLARTGDMGAKLAFRRKKTSPQRLVMILDVSHSMYYYSPLIARFMRALALTFPKSEAFCFHIQLHRITKALQHRKAERVVEEMDGRNGLWLGGTKISQSLEDLMADHSEVLKGRKTTVLLFSDGFDTMSAEDLGDCLARMKKQVHKIYWVNPHLVKRQNVGQGGSDTLSQAKQWLDGEFPGHSLEGLACLARALER